MSIFCNIPHGRSAKINHLVAGVPVVQDTITTTAIEFADAEGSAIQEGNIRFTNANTLKYTVKYELEGSISEIDTDSLIKLNAITVLINDKVAPANWINTLVVNQNTTNSINIEIAHNGCVVAQNITIKVDWSKIEGVVNSDASANPAIYNVKTKASEITIKAQTPAPAAVNIPINTDIRVQFSEGIYTDAIDLFNLLFFDWNTYSDGIVTLTWTQDAADKAKWAATYTVILDVYNAFGFVPTNTASALKDKWGNVVELPTPGGFMTEGTLAPKQAAGCFILNSFSKSGGWHATFTLTVMNATKVVIATNVSSAPTMPTNPAASDWTFTVADASSSITIPASTTLEEYQVRLNGVAKNKTYFVSAWAQSVDGAWVLLGTASVKTPPR